MEHFKTKYGYFNENGDFVVTNPKTPRPWINVLTNGKYGAIYSQSGSGYSFYIDASRSLLTRWIQDLVRDEYGKYFYIVNEETGEIFSSTYQPVKKKGDYKVLFSPGKVIFQTSFEKFSIETTVVVPMNYDVEIVKIELENKTDDVLKLSIFSYFELNMGTSADVHREFHRLFFETSFVENTLISKKHMWTAGPRSWNSSYPFVLFHTSTKKVESYETDKESFLGMYGTLQNPEALELGRCRNTLGRNIDGINSLHVRVSLKAHEKKVIYFLIGVSESEERALDISKKFQNEEFCESQIRETIEHWSKFLEKFKVEVPEKDIEFLLNKWLPYQAIAGRLMARTAYYQMGGAFGYRDQLQDSLAALWLDPFITKKQIILHASHQRKDGSVQHWWLPFSNSSPAERWSDDLLWLVFVVCEYIEHTGDKQILRESVPFLEGEDATIKEHCMRSIRSVLSNVSKRGIPLILGGDWNDGLNGLGQKGRGESFWLSEFLFYTLKRVLELFELDDEEREWIANSMESLKKSFNEHAWNGKWFNRATSDEGKIVGGLEDERIFLNPQNWAVISGISEEEKCEKAMKEMKEKLITDYGPLLLFPPFTEIDRKIGYITRYAPGTRENGGVYTHAAVWTLWSSWMRKDHELADKVYSSLSPILRYYKDPDLYGAEPYVTPGNSDGPLSPRKGRAGWTWYTGSASWLYRSLIQYYLGIKPIKEGILFSPCTQKCWKQATIEFQIRGGKYRLEISNPEGKALHEFKEIIFNGKRLEGNLIPYSKGENRILILY